MKIISSIFFSFIIVGASASTLDAKEWHRITPLRSTRADVIRLLGPSLDADETRAIYRLDKENVNVLFALRGDLFSCGCAKEVTVGTVLKIEIHPQTEIPITDLQVDEKKIKRFNRTSPPLLGYYGYLDKENGLIYKTSPSGVEEIDYVAALGDLHLCPTYYEDLRIYAPEREIIEPPPCSMIVITCPTEEMKSGTWVTISVRDDSWYRPKPSLSYKWKVSAGRIVSGQGTPSIMVDTQGLDGRYITATVEIGRNGLPAACELVRTASCSVHVIKDKVKDVRNQPSRSKQ